MANQITKTHADWLSLIEISGPFVSMPILAEVFPQGLEDVPPELARSLRADFEFWQENANDVAVHSAWVRLVLESLLGYVGAGLDKFSDASADRKDPPVRSAGGVGANDSCGVEGGISRT